MSIDWNFVFSLASM